MGDFSPSCVSSHGLLMVFNEMGKRSINAVVSLFKKIRLPDSNYGRGACSYLQSTSDLFWLVYASVAFGCVNLAIVRLSPIMKLAPSFGPHILAFITVGGWVTHVLVLLSVLCWYREKPFMLTGAKNKFMVDVIPMITATAFRFLGFNYLYLTLQIGCLSYFFVFSHFTHTAYDLGESDLFVGVAMQLLMYKLEGELLVRALAFTCCLGLCFIRYMRYRPPAVPAHHKKELGQQQLLPC